MGSAAFAAKNIDGSGVRVAVLDAGFPEVDTHPAFAHIRKNNRIVKTYDFVKKREHVYGYSQHGTNVLSCIAGKSDSLPFGLATGAEFLLARTENALREPFSEEENWLAAIEWADKNGADIVNSSLAYTKHRYFPFEMNGKNSFVSKAARIAASKGIVVVNAAGNDGENDWKVIGTPGDADSILTVGGIDPATDFHIAFSSYGPSRDKRIKPNVSAFGEAVVAGKGGTHITQGTSFASPLVAGFVACAWQANPDLTNMELLEEIQQSGHLYPYYDYAHGFGVPQARYFTRENTDPALPTFRFSTNDVAIAVTVNKEVLETGNRQLLYYHIENTKGYLSRYYVIEVSRETPLSFYMSQFNPGEILRVHFNGYTQEYEF